VIDVTSPDRNPAAVELQWERNKTAALPRWVFSKDFSVFLGSSAPRLLRMGHLSL
jgi:hypothetical protein